MQTAQLLFALKLAQPCVVGVDFIPVLQHFCFDKERVLAYDEVSAIIVDLQSDLHCAVRADTLAQLAALAAAEISLKQDEEGKVLFESGSTTATLPSLPPEEFAFTEPKQDKGAVKFDLDDKLFSALQICAAGVGKDPHFRSQTAVVLVTGAKPALYAADGTSLVKCALSTALGNERRQALIPKSVCDQVKHIVTALGCLPSEVSVRLTKQNIIVEFKHDTWTVRLVGNLLVDEKAAVDEYESLISTAADDLSILRMDDEFGSAVDKVAVVVSADINKECKLVVADGNLEVTGVGALGEARTVLKARTGLKGPKPKDSQALIDPERLTRYRERLTHIALSPSGVAMYDNKEPEKAFLSYVSACYPEAE